MLKTLARIFEDNTIEIDDAGTRIKIHSNTSKEQGIFLQQIFDKIKPKQSIEVGFAYGISAMFILEKHAEAKSSEPSHLVIEPDDYWGDIPMHNIKKEGLEKYISIKNDYSHTILTRLFHQNYRVQYAYIDTTKQFDVVFQDFYFIDKILDIGGVVIFDDCGGGWPGIQRVARFVNTLPHYQLIDKHGAINMSIKKKIAHSFVSFLVNLIPFKMAIYSSFNFETDKQLGLNYACLVFKKIATDNRLWNWDKPF